MSEEIRKLSSKILCPKCKKVSTFSEIIKDGYFDRNVCDKCGAEFVKGDAMELYDRHYYEKDCLNGHHNFALTQDDDSPEYHTDVGVKCCKCKEIVWFSLPVN